MLRISDTPKLYSWIYDISLLKHSMQGILHAIYGYERSKLPCPEVRIIHIYNILSTYINNQWKLWMTEINLLIIYEFTR